MLNFGSILDSFRKQNLEQVSPQAAAVPIQPLAPTNPGISAASAIAANPVMRPQTGPLTPYAPNPGMSRNIGDIFGQRKQQSVVDRGVDNRRFFAGLFGRRF